MDQNYKSVKSSQCAVFRQSKHERTTRSIKTNYFFTMCMFFFLCLQAGEAFAQVNINETFNTSTAPTGWNGGTGGFNQTFACATYSWRKNIKSTATSGQLRTPTWVSNGQPVNISFKYKVINWQGSNVAATNYDGTITTQLSTNGGSTYTVNAGQINSSNHVTSNSCATVNYTVPGTSVPNGNTIRVQFLLNWGTTGDHYIYIDDVVITQASGSAPECANLTSPNNGASVSDVAQPLNWDAAATATSYDVYFGTSEEPPFVTNTTALSYLPEIDASTNYYWKVVPKNAFGSATGCETRSFTTTSVLACSPGIGNDDCSTATLIYFGTTMSGNTCASSSIGVADPSCNAGQPNYFDSWYKFNTGSTTFIDLSLGATSPSAVGFALYSGTCGSFTQVSGACNNTGLATSITGLSKNTVYYLRVYSTLKSARGDFSINLSVPCTQPTGISVTNTLNSAMVSWTASTALPMDGYQYEVRTSGAGGSGASGLVASGSSMALSKEITGLSANTNYTLYMRSACGNGTYSNWTTGVSFFTGFCTPAPTSGIGNGITNVMFGEVNNTTGAESGNYGDYTSMAGAVQRGGNAAVNVSLSSSDYVSVWVDWNNDLDFDDAGEDVYAAESQSDSFEIAFDVPLSAATGPHRMRIGAGSSPTITACHAGSLAAFEDYTLNVETEGPVHLNDAACNSTISNFTQGLYVSNYAGVESYRFRVQNGSDHEIITRTVPYITLNMLTSPAYGVTYTIDVAAMIAGEWTDYGKVCTVSTEGEVPLSRLEQCTEGGTSVSSFSKPIYAQHISYATAYRFMVTSTEGTFVFDRPVRYFSLNMLANYAYNTDYSVRVAVLSGNIWSEYGDACTVRVNMPTVILRPQYCNGTVTKKGQAIYANNYPGAALYHFRVTVGSSQYTVVRNVGYFMLSQVPTFIPFGTTVGVEVKVFVVGAESDWGAMCNVTLANPNGRPGAEEDSEQSTGRPAQVSSYPNPFTETFSVDFGTESYEAVGIVVYDMTGKLVDRLTVSAEELPSLKLGQNFAPGVYNLILTQGETIKTVRIVKGN